MALDESAASRRDTPDNHTRRQRKMKLSKSRMRIIQRYCNDLTAEKVRELLDYDPLSGILTWRVDRTNGNNRVNAHAGDHAGSINSKGYICIGINGAYYLAHRIAWLWQTGEWPKEEIDHVNLVRHDNRWANLREATPSENAANRLPRLSSLPRGVWITRYGKIVAKIANIHLGTFATVEEAGEAYAAMAYALYGEFYRGAPAIATAPAVETTPRLWRRI
jgi:hypothetical protein